MFTKIGEIKMDAAFSARTCDFPFSRPTLYHKTSLWHTLEGPITLFFNLRIFCIPCYKENLLFLGINLVSKELFLTFSDMQSWYYLKKHLLVSIIERSLKQKSFYHFVPLFSLFSWTTIQMQHTCDFGERDAELVPLLM